MHEHALLFASSFGQRTVSARAFCHLCFHRLHSSAGTRNTKVKGVEPEEALFRSFQAGNVRFEDDNNQGIAWCAAARLPKIAVSLTFKEQFHCMNMSAYTIEEQPSSYVADFTRKKAEFGVLIFVLARRGMLHSILHTS